MVSARKWLAVLAATVLLAWVTWLAYIAFGETGIIAMVVVIAFSAWLEFRASERTGAKFLRVGMTVLFVGAGVYIAYATAILYGPLIAIGAAALIGLFAWKTLSEI